MLRTPFTQRPRGSSMPTVPPPLSSSDYSPELAEVAKSIIYRSPIPSPSGLPIYILSAAALPDAKEIDFDALLPYVLNRLPDEDELLSGQDYEVVFFAGGAGDGATAVKKSQPSWGWVFQAYQALSRALRKRLQRLYIVHERAWVRVLVDALSTVASPKSRKKITHASTISSLALQIPIENLLIPPSAYIHDRRLTLEIYAPYVSGRRAFSVHQALPRDKYGRSRLPRVLRETTGFILMGCNIETEGIFRISPHSKLIGVLHEAYNRGQKFILWKENGVSLPCPDYEDTKDAQLVIDEISPCDAYGVALASSLIKVWYRDLRQPIFPVSSYAQLREIYGNLQEQPEMENIVDLFSEDPKLPLISPISREILVRHLLPLLSLVEKHSEKNKMTAQNLAVCFAPTLLRGPDQFQDAKVSSVIRHILETAISTWDDSLRNALHVDSSDFMKDIQPPKSLEDYEDPLEERCVLQRGDNSQQPQHYVSQPTQVTGVTTKTGPSVSSSQSLEEKPPLPPRPVSSSSVTAEESSERTASEEEKVKRKPAPAMANLPRYSTVILRDAITLDDDISTQPEAVADGFVRSSLNVWNDQETSKE